MNSTRPYIIVANAGQSKVYVVKNGDLFEAAADFQIATVFSAPVATDVVSHLNKLHGPNWGWAAISLARFDDEGNRKSIDTD